MKTFLTLALAASIIVAFTSAPAEAKHKSRTKHNAPKHRVIRDVTPLYAGTTEDLSARRHRYRYRQRYVASGNVVGHPAGCPGRAFCGCGVSVKVFGRPVKNLFLASNWLKFPRATPAPGMVAARRGHVMYIIAYDGNGNATVYDPNSGGGATRIHQRSLAGYTVVNPHGGATEMTARAHEPRRRHYASHKRQRMAVHYEQPYYVDRFTAQ